MRTHPVRLGVALAAVLAIAAGLYWFQPWKLFIDHTVNEALPAVALTSSPAPAPVPVPVDDVTGPATTAPRRTASPTAALLARGRLITHEHETRGQVSVVRQADGSRVLAIAGLRTSDGPDVRVWLTDAPVRHGEKGWYLFDDGRYVDLGGLKGNLGNQVYRIPRSVDLRRYTSVSLWCRRFSVSFGAAALTRVG